MTITPCRLFPVVVGGRALALTSPAVAPLLHVVPGRTRLGVLLVPQGIISPSLSKQREPLSQPQIGARRRRRLCWSPPPVEQQSTRGTGWERVLSAQGTGEGKNFFPEQMVAWCQQSNGCIPQSQLLQEPRHLQLLADLEDSNIFSLIAGKKMYNAPTDYGFCIKPNRVRNETKELRLLCAEDEQSRTCWMTAFRLLKYGMLLYQNYRIPQQRTALLPHFTTPVAQHSHESVNTKLRLVWQFEIWKVRSVSENSLVAMDFSGQIGRVIENPAEAQSAALEEGHAWRVREPLCQTGSCGNLKRLTAILTQCLTAKPEQWSKRRADDNIASSSMTVDVETQHKNEHLG
ncbi:Growth factor receptor-bound protein 10 [Varanus komodoensis]|nr:Growth factor receptor-bound protein 10 [Varanus komodoensis]